MSQPYDQPTNAPTTKVAAVGISGAVTVLVMYLIKTFFNVDVPADVAAAFTTIVAFASGYFIRETK